MNRGQDAELAMHLLLNSERQRTWAATSGAYQTRQEGKHGGAGGVMPMDGPEDAYVDGLDGEASRRKHQLLIYIVQTAAGS